jgi:hypothetical protein
MGLEEVMKVEPSWWNQSFYKERHQWAGSLSPIFHVRSSWEGATYKPRRGPSSELDCAGTLIRLSASQAMRNESFYLKAPGYELLWQLKVISVGQAQWLTSIIPATWGFRPPQAKSWQDPLSKNQSGLVVFTCSTSCLERIGIRIVVWGQPGQKVQDPMQKITKKQKDLEVWLKW